MFNDLRTGFVAIVAVSMLLLTAGLHTANAQSTIAWPTNKTTAGGNYTGPVWTATGQANMVFFDITPLTITNIPNGLNPVSASVNVYLPSTTVPGTYQTTATVTINYMGKFGPVAPVGNLGNCSTFSVTDGNKTGVPTNVGNVMITVSVTFQNAQKANTAVNYPIFYTTPTPIAPAPNPCPVPCPGEIGDPLVDAEDKRS